MTRNRPVLLGALIAAVAAVLLAVLVVRPSNVAAPSPAPTVSASATPTATATPSVSPSAAATSAPPPSATASPAGGRYVSALLGYSLDLPPPWHRSSCNGVVTQQTPTPMGEEFWPVAVRDETGTDMGVAYPAIRVFAEANPQGLTPRQWAESGRSVGGTRQGIEDVTFADRPAARQPDASTPPTYYVANAGRMYVVNPSFHTPPDAATLQTMARIVESFRFLTSAEQAAARAALPSAAPPRTPEQVGDGVAAAFAAKNADALAAFLSPCVTTAGENAGGSFVSREKYVDDLRARFAAGLVVIVQARTFDGDRARGDLTIQSTWHESSGPQERKLMLRRGDNERWEWQGTIERFR
jgi:hypothetical protein